MGTQSIMFDLFLSAAMAIIGRLAAKHWVRRVASETPLVSAPHGPDAITV